MAAELPTGGPLNLHFRGQLVRSPRRWIGTALWVWKASMTDRLELARLTARLPRAHN